MVFADASPSILEIVIGIEKMVVELLVLIVE